MTLKPKKKYINVICDVCDLAWDDHVPGDDGNVDVSECVRLLKAKIPQSVRCLPSYTYLSISPTGYFCACGVWVAYGSMHQCFPNTWTVTNTGGAYSLSTELMCSTESNVSS